jgi:hypothetical protein
MYRSRTGPQMFVELPPSALVHVATVVDEHAGRNCLYHIIFAEFPMIAASRKTRFRLR